MTKPLIKPEDIRTGDTLRITALVTAENWPLGPNVGIELSHAELASAKIELLDRPALKAGSRVRHGRYDFFPGTIVATDGDEAWVRWENANNPRDYSTVKLSNLAPA
ncbi:MAG: hypothetical protein ACK4FG_01810 [Brevundimonas sp.]